MFLTTIKNYSFNQFYKDVIAGIIVAIIALPLSIALAISSGVGPEVGLHTAIIGGFIVSFLGGSKVQIGGPTGAFMIIVYGTILKFGVDGLILATLMAGLIMIVMGIFKLGAIVKFIPYPITTGFTTGIAVIIFTSQIKDLLGLDIGALPSEFIAKWEIYFSNLNTINFFDLSIGLFTIAIVILWPKINKKVPGALIAIIVTSIITSLVSFDIETIGTRFSTISSALPQFHIPGFDKELIILLIPSALAIAFLGSIESLLSAVVSDAMINDKHRSNTEIIAQGIANSASALFGGIPVTGAIARTTANVKNGGRTPVAGMVHAIVLLIILLLFMPYAKLIPLSALAGILVVVAYNMSEWRNFVKLFSSSKSDIIILLVTFFITVFVDLVIAISVGMILAALLFMKKMSEETTFQIREMYDDVEGTKPKARHTIIYRVNGPLFYGAAERFSDSINEISHDIKNLILVIKNVQILDSTAQESLHKFVNLCKKQNIRLIVVGANPQPIKILQKTKLYDKIGKENFYEKIQPVINEIKLQNASQLIITQ
ncbi:MAG: sulfate permease [Bacilli bacterium]|nr:sulfate permease [Bacilli bacterium]